jgi:uncharacterized membrane protein
MADLAASGSAQTAPEHHAPTWLRQAVQRLEGAPELDRPRAVLGGLAGRLTSNPSVRDALRGESFGHAIHPLLTDYPLGAWVSVTVLDLCAAKRLRPAATLLTGFGVSAAIPTALSGMAEWATADPESQRVGVAHAVINSGATACYAASWIARLRGRHGRGVLLGLLGGCFAWVGGYLGGHLSLVRKIGTADTAFQSSAAPAQS